MVREHGLENETKHFFDHIFDDKWLMIVENGSKEQYEAELAKTVDPMVQSIMGITGE